MNEKMFIKGGGGGGGSQLTLSWSQKAGGHVNLLFTDRIDSIKCVNAFHVEIMVQVEILLLG